ncbi:MAG TPA: AAA family ATPase [Gaiellaceae bacterium]
MAGPSRIRTFVIADVRGYTTFTERHGDEAAAALALKFARLAREAVESRGGSIVELRGDEALAVFDSPRQALRASVELQARVTAETAAEPTLPLDVGIGLDAGEAVRVGDGYRGGALNLAARLAAEAAPGEVLASKEVVHLARKVDQVVYLDRGSVRLRGLARPVEVVAVRAERALAERATPTMLDEGTELLERSHQLALLGEHLAVVRSGARGWLAFVAGEAGVGKTALVRRFCDEQRRGTRVLWGACDALFTPRPLAPIADIARTTRGELERLTEGDARPHEVAAELMRNLAAHGPTIVVLEDLHWADEATLDVLRIVGRRLETLPALLVGTYRDDQLDRSHPLRIVLGELALRDRAVRIDVGPLSPAAVATLAAAGGGVEPDELYRKTAGNPFFVTEVLAAEGDAIPGTVRDAVLARAARLGSASRSLLEAVAVVPPQAELWLLEAIAPESMDRLSECLGSGMLASEGGGVAFRHELARLAVEESLAPDRRLALHRKALAALASAAAHEPDHARLAHHAEAAGDAEAVCRYAPLAAEQAAAHGAHRQAVAQYERALRFAHGLRPEDRARLAELHSWECSLTGRVDEALDSQERALQLRRELGDTPREAESLRALSRLLRLVGRIDEAADVGGDAIALLERSSPGRELALAYANLGHVFVTADDGADGVVWARRALELAEQLDDDEARTYALTLIGASEYIAGRPEGLEQIERSAGIARKGGLDEHAGRALLNLVWFPMRHRDYAAAARQLDTALEFCSERGLDLWHVFLVACRARIDLDHGRWAEAADAADVVRRDPRTWPVPRVLALSVLGLVRARRGDPDVWAPLDEAWALAEPTGELQRIWPAAAARAEAAWLQGRLDTVAGETRAALDLALLRQNPWAVGELASWCERAGLQADGAGDAAPPWAAQLGGEPQRAFELWSELGCPYEAAVSLADADDEEPLRRALSELQRLEAQPAATMVAQRLRERGAQRLPRGPRRTTQVNPAQLTARELEVLTLLARGLRNSEIAGELVISPRTVDHHVAAIFRKLSVRTRVQATAEAVRLGLAYPS